MNTFQIRVGGSVPRNTLGKSEFTNLFSLN
jgi:hypothetical protein